MTNNDKKLQVDFFSQYDEEIPTEKQNTACGIASAKMVIDYITESSVSIGELLAERDRLGVAIPGIGSSHAGLAMLMRNFGVLAYPQEFKSRDNAFPAFREKSLVKITLNIDAGVPVIASIDRPELGSTHLLVISGYRGYEGEPEGFYLHDPEQSSYEERYMPTDEFKTLSRWMYIFSDK